ncbi:hypothetical protein GCM10027053_15530 [Intrasporangium mesophilum]
MDGVGLVGPDRFVQSLETLDLAGKALADEHTRRLGLVGLPRETLPGQTHRANVQLPQGP